MSNYRFDHIHLRSPDPLKTAQFYETMFSAKRVEIQPRYGSVSIRLDLNGQLVIISPPPPVENSRLAQYGLNHFGLITDNLEKVVDDLKNKGITFLMDVTPLSSTTKVSFLLAPENVLVEILSKS